MVAADELHHFVEYDLGLVCLGGCTVNLRIFVFCKIAVECGKDPIEYAFALLPCQLDV